MIRTAWIYPDYRGLGGTEYLITNMILLLSGYTSKLLIITRYEPNAAWKDKINGSSENIDLLVLGEDLDNPEILENSLVSHKVDSVCISPLEEETFKLISILSPRYKLIGLEPCDLSDLCWWLPHDLSLKLPVIDHLMVLNNASAENAKKLYGFRKEITVIPNSLMAVEKHPSDQMPIENSIGCICRLSAEKGLEYLLAAVKMCHKVIPDLDLNIYGDGADHERLVQQARMLGISDRVHFHCEFHPFRDIDKLVSSHELFVLPSLFEGTPISALEVISRGKALVCSDTEGSRYLLDSLQELKFEIGNTKELSDLILNLLMNEEQRAAAVQKSMQQVESRFDRKHTLSALLDVYKAIEFFER